MKMPLNEDADLRDPGNAEILCRICELTYLPEAAGKPEFGKLGFEAQFFSQGNTQAYLATNDDNIVLAFRGTEAAGIEGLKDWLLTNAVNLLVVPEGRLGHDLSAAGVGAKFHKGFSDAIASIWDPVSTAVEAEWKRLDRPVWVTGHSLGGALALLAAWLLKRRFVPIHRIVTFGAPMIGNQVACEAFNREFAGRIVRYVHGKDPVPKMPALSLVANEYAHVESESLLGSDPMTNLFDFLGSIGSRAAGGVLQGTLLDETWRYVVDHVSTHFLDAYAKLIETVKPKA